MPPPDQTQQKSDNPPLPDKTKKFQGDGRTASRKTYITFLHFFYYFLIPPFSMDRIPDKLHYPVSKYFIEENI